jgi:hypothetical protein
METNGIDLEKYIKSTIICLDIETRRYFPPTPVIEPAIHSSVFVRGDVFAQRHAKPKRAPWALPAIFWTMLALGILVKGPIILMIVGLAVATLVIIDRSARWLVALRPLLGTVLLLVLVLPWLVALYLRVGSEFLTRSIGEDMMAKVTSGQEYHGAPPGLYVLLFFVTFFPGSAQDSKNCTRVSPIAFAAPS